jgi:hypothetical protein
MKRFDAIAFLAERDYRDMAVDQCLHELQSQVRVMRTTRRQLERRQLEDAMRQAERIGDTKKRDEIMEAFQRLSRET